MAREIIIGGEGQALLNNWDVEVSDVDINEDVAEEEITCTADWDEAKQKLFRRDVTTGYQLSGTMTAHLDNQNYPPDNVESGKIYPLTIRLKSGRLVTMAEAKIGGLGLRPGGVVGAWSVTIPFKSQGVYDLGGTLY